MGSYETVEIPTLDLSDGRKAIRLADYIERDYVRSFVKAWPDYWTFDTNLDCFVSPEQTLPLVKNGAV